MLAYLTFMLLIDWRLTLLFIAMAPVLGLVVAFASNRFRRISRRIQHSMGDVTHVVSEVASGYREVKIFGGQEKEESRFSVGQQGKPPAEHEDGRYQGIQFANQRNHHSVGSLRADRRLVQPGLVQLSTAKR